MPMAMNTLDIFNTYYLAGLVSTIEPEQMFFRDRYFPTGEDDIFKADKVLVEYEEKGRRMAPFVVRRKGDIPVAREGYEVHELEPPYVAPSRLLTLDDLDRRGFGEALLSGRTPGQRAVAMQVADMRDLDARITRREEWMAAQTMVHNGFTAVSYIDGKAEGVEYHAYYYDRAGGDNPALYTVGGHWDADAGGAAFWADVQAMCELLADRGLPATDLVVGTATGAYIQHNEIVKEWLDNRRFEYGQMAPSVRYPGVAWLGHLNFGGFDLDIFVVRETYVGDDGVARRQFPEDAAMAAAPGCGHFMYGQVSQLEPDEQFHTFAARRVPKFTADREGDTRKLRLACRPLAAPKYKAPWIFAPHVVKA